MINSQDVLTITDNGHETCWPLTLSQLISTFHSRLGIFKQACEINNNGPQWCLTSCLEASIISNLTYDAMERSPMDYRDYVDWHLPCLLTVAIPSVSLWPVSTSPKRSLLSLSLLNFALTAWLDGCGGEQASVRGRGSVRARGESAGCRTMGLLYVASVRYYCFSRQQDTCKLERGCTIFNWTV